MTTRANMVRREAREILIAARVAALRRLAEDTSKAFEQELARSGMTREHFRLRLMLRGMLEPPPRPSSRE
jgi:hypothetical protein